jgi:hypothetical protein
MAKKRGGKKLMELAIAGAIAVSVVLWILSGVAQYKHRETAVIWTVYFAIVFTILVFFLTWQKREWESVKPANGQSGQPTRLPEGPRNTGMTVAPQVPVSTSVGVKVTRKETQPEKPKEPKHDVSQSQGPAHQSDSGPKRLPFPGPYDGIKWTDYTEDYFGGAIWRWKYRPEMGREPYGIVGFCPDCERSLFPGTGSHHRGPDNLIEVGFYCRFHTPYKWFRFKSPTTDALDALRVIIRRNVETEAWREVVKRQIDAREGRI